MLIIGTGCVAESVLPLLWQYFPLRREQVVLLGADNDAGRKLAQRYGLTFSPCILTPLNYAAELARHLSGGDVLLNLALGVGSLDLMAWCRERNIIYVDSNLEPWTGQTHSLALARLHALRWRGHGSPTAVFGHGANPGLITHFLKEALGLLAPDATTWYEAARALDIRVLVISEFDSHNVSTCPDRSNHGKRENWPEFEFANTWSGAGLAGELCAPAEFAWGGHEEFTPPKSILRTIGRGSALQLPTSGKATVVRSWTPSACEFHGYLLSHLESFSMAELLSSPDVHALTRPTVFYAVRPCFTAETAIRKMTGDVPPSDWRYGVLKNELCDGGIELGILLLGKHLSYWYGSHLTLSEARRLVPDNNATSLQVAAGVLGALVWALENPRCGAVEAESMDHHRVLEVARPYLGNLYGVEANWRPSAKSELRFEDFLASEPRLLR